MLLVLRERANGDDANEVPVLADSAWDPPHRSQAFRGNRRLHADRGGVTAQAIDGLSPDYLFGSYRRNQARFSCHVRDEWDVATLLRVLSREV